MRIQRIARDRRQKGGSRDRPCAVVRTLRVGGHGHGHFRRPSPLSHTSSSFRSRGLPASVAILRQALANHAIDCAQRPRGRERIRDERGRLGRQNRSDHAGRRSLERAPPRQHLVQHAPKAKMSLRASASLPCNCSGDMYCSVPTICPSAVSASATWLAVAPLRGRYAWPGRNRAA